jgi:hypothetical protein
MTSITAIVPRMAVDIVGSTVRIELICTDEYAARVLYEDILSRGESDEGLMSSLKFRRTREASE